MVTPKTGGIMGFAVKRSFSNSASWSLFDLALRFWNQILTCVSVKFRDDENSARSAIDKYCFCRNFLSRASSCAVVNGVRGFRFGLCFLRVHIFGTPIFCGADTDSAKKGRNYFSYCNFLFQPKFYIALLKHTHTHTHTHNEKYTHKNKQ